MVPRKYEHAVNRGVGRLMSEKHLPLFGARVGPQKAGGEGRVYETGEGVGERTGRIGSKGKV